MKVKDFSFTYDPTCSPESGSKAKYEPQVAKCLCMRVYLNLKCIAKIFVWFECFSDFLLLSEATLTKVVVINGRLATRKKRKKGKKDNLWWGTCLHGVIWRAYKIVALGQGLHCAFSAQTGHSTYSCVVLSANGQFTQPTAVYSTY